MLLLLCMLQKGVPKGVDPEHHRTLARLPAQDGGRLVGNRACVGMGGQGEGAPERPRWWRSAAASAVGAERARSLVRGQQGHRPHHVSVRRCARSVHGRPLRWVRGEVMHRASRCRAIPGGVWSLSWLLCKPLPGHGWGSLRWPPGKSFWVGRLGARVSIARPSGWRTMPARPRSS